MNARWYVVVSRNDQITYAGSSLAWAQSKGPCVWEIIGERQHVGEVLDVDRAFSPLHECTSASELCSCKGDGACGS